MKELTREELAHGRALLKAAFDGPWRYTQFEIECSACNSYEQGLTDTECANPECNGEEVPATFVEAPRAYPGESDEYRAQVVATIDVPGLSCLAEKNGEAICWLRNEGPALIDASELLLELRAALAFIAAHERHQGWPITIRGADDLIPYAKSLGWTGDRNA